MGIERTPAISPLRDYGKIGWLTVFFFCFGVQCLDEYIDALCECCNYRVARCAVPVLCMNRFPGGVEIGSQVRQAFGGPGV